MSECDIKLLIMYVVGCLLGGSVTWSVMKNRMLKLKLEIMDLRFNRREQ